MIVKEIICDCGWTKSVSEGEFFPIFCPKCEGRGENCFKFVFDTLKFNRALMARSGMNLNLSLLCQVKWR